MGWWLWLGVVGLGVQDWKEMDDRKSIKRETEERSDVDVDVNLDAFCLSQSRRRRHLYTSPPSPVPRPIPRSPVCLEPSLARSDSKIPIPATQLHPADCGHRLGLHLQVAAVPELPRRTRMAQPTGSRKEARFGSSPLEPPPQNSPGGCRRVTPSPPVGNVQNTTACAARDATTIPPPTFTSTRSKTKH